MKKIYSFIVVLGLSAFVSRVEAQSPGGVSTNLTMWVKSNANTVATGGFLDIWGYSNNLNTYTSFGTDRPQLVPAVLNFNPAVRFTGGMHFLDGPTGINAPIAAGDDDYTMFAVWSSNTVSNFQRVWSQRNVCAPCNMNDAFTLSTWNDGRYGDEAGIPPFDHTIPRNYTVGTWNINQLNVLNQPVNDLEIIDDRNFSTGIITLNTDPSATNGAALRVLGDNVNRIGANFSPGSDLDGDIAELIVFDRPVSGAERNRIFSYLALKYGITIKGNLLSGSGATVWNATTNATYNNSVFGLALDLTSGLFLTQSNSIETGSGNGTGQSGKANIVLSSPSSFDDNDFLIIGNDNATLAEQTGSTDVAPSVAGSFRLGREWRVQHTGNIGTVNATIDLNGITQSGTIPANFRLMIDEDGNGNFANGTTRFYTPTSFTGGILTFTGITLNNGEVFALLTQKAGVLPVTWISFTGKTVNKTASLDWEVANNSGAKEYQIERSTDGVTFTNIGTVTNSATVKNYHFSYNLASGVNYFRIRQVDLDGRANYSRTVSIKGSDVVLYLVKNPIRDGSVQVGVDVVKRAEGLIQITSTSGAVIVSQKISISQGVNIFTLPIDKAAAGTYILKLSTGDNILTERILKL